MKLLQLYNQYRSNLSGEENVVRATAALVEKNGGSARLFMPTSRGIDKSLPKKIRAFFSGIYSFQASVEVARILETDRPDIVHAHNLYPLLSPSVLVACKRAGVPVVLSLHNFAQTCPNYDHYSHGRVCERCMEHGEMHCILNNCRGSFAENMTYAMRSYLARKSGVYQKNVDLFVCLTQFAKNHCVRAGFDAGRIKVLTNMANPDQPLTDPAKGKYVAFAGFMVNRKGVRTLLEVARQNNGIPFCLAGEGPDLDAFKSAAPANVRFLGGLNNKDMQKFYSQARVVVVPSEWYEMCPLVISEAMSHGIPVVASRIGGIPELVDDGATGLLFEPSDINDLADKIHTLWNAPELCRRLGANGRKKAVCNFGEANYYKSLAAIYDEAIGRKMFAHNEPPARPA
jgi:glycosyltransferase involved in cell wall biosynthesis